jgi:hypothetical protein
MTEHDHRLIYQRLEEAIGSEAAAKLMAQFPPFDWADVATKHDDLGERFEAQLQRTNRLLATLIAVIAILLTVFRFA